MSGSTVTYTAAGTCVIDANQAGNATWAAAPQVQRTITVSKIPQSITFTAPASGAMSSRRPCRPPRGSGNPVVFSVDPASGAKVCTVSGSTVTYTAAGTCVIDANQAGNATWAAAPQVQRTIAVILGAPVPRNFFFFLAVMRHAGCEREESGSYLVTWRLTVSGRPRLRVSVGDESAALNICPVAFRQRADSTSLSGCSAFLPCASGEDAGVASQEVQPGVEPGPASCGPASGE